jgi:hypothetical protein
MLLQLPLSRAWWHQPQPRSGGRSTRRLGRRGRVHGRHGGPPGAGDSGVSEWTRRTDLATNIGAGVTYRLSEHLGLNVDWRTFFVNGDNDVERVNRFTTGFSVSLR